jgi:hypothetical protein
VFNHYQHQQHPQKNPMDSLCLMQNAYLWNILNHLLLLYNI